MSRSVKGKTAVVTGAGSGINLEFARVLLNNGCNVVVGDIALRPEAQKLYAEYDGSSSDKARATFVKTDATNWDDLTRLFKSAEEQFGNYDIVCPGAGIFEPPFSGFWYPPGNEKSKDDPSGGRYKQIDLNLVHPIRSSQIAISHFLGSASPENPKTIVLIASIASEIAFIPVAMYCTTKWAIRGFLYSMAELEESRHIRVAGVAPAIVRTPIWLDAEEKRRMILTAEGDEQNDWTTPEEVAEVMFKLCTENQIANSKGDFIPIRGGSLIEVINEDVRDVPAFGNEPPGTGTAGKGTSMANPVEAWKDMNAEVDKGGWGKY